MNKFFSLYSWIAKKVAYLYTMTNANMTAMNWEKTEVSTYLHTESHYYSISKSGSSWFLLRRNKETSKGCQSRYRTKREAMQQAEEYAIGRDWL
jgi:hypothetical protein